MAQTYLSFVVTAACFCDFHKADDWAADKGSAIFCWHCLWDRLSQGKNWLFDHWKYLDGQTYWLLITNHVWCLTMSDPNKYQPMDIPGYVYKASYTIAPGDHPSSTPRVFFFFWDPRGVSWRVYIPRSRNSHLCWYLMVLWWPTCFPKLPPCLETNLSCSFCSTTQGMMPMLNGLLKNLSGWSVTRAKTHVTCTVGFICWCKSKDAEVQLLRFLPQVQPGCWYSMIIAGWKKA